MTPNDIDRWLPAWMDLVRTHARVWEEIEARMRQEGGMTMSRYDVLMQLDLAGGRLGLTDLASTVLLSPSGLSKLLDRMEASGLLTREPDPTDARSTFARITPRGRSLVRKARVHHHACVQQVFGDALDDRDLADLSRVMRRVGAQLPIS